MPQSNQEYTARRFQSLKTENAPPHYDTGFKAFGIGLILGAVVTLCSACAPKDILDVEALQKWLSKTQLPAKASSYQRDRDSFDSVEQYQSWKRYCALQLKADEAYSEADPLSYNLEGPPGPNEERLRVELMEPEADLSQEQIRKLNSR
jgi:hypothetical protein